MAKRNLKKEIVSQPVQSSIEKNSGNGFFWNWLPKGGDIIPFVFFLLFFGVEFLPGFGGIDDMGTQWFYMLLLDIAAILYILDKKIAFDLPIATLLKNTFSRLYLALFLLAGVSVLLALNPTEGWVCYARFIASFIGYFVIAILLYGRIHLFRLIAVIMSIILFIQSLQTLTFFFSEMHNFRFTELILNLKGRAGNKNIFAASLVSKIPFVLFCIYSGNKINKIFFSIIFVAASLTILLINSRTTYLAYIFEILLYLTFCLQQYFKGLNKETNLLRVGFVVVSVVLASFISLIAVSTAKSSFVDENTDANQYGSITERLATVASSADESNRERLFLWKHAIDYSLHHPFMGCGYGNWKIASIPYTKELTDDLLVPIHAHNDFLEYFAELGFGGGLLFISLFVCLIVYTLKTWFSNVSEEVKIISAFSFIALVGYAIDAFFNFPIERPVNQVFFLIIIAVNVTAYNSGKAETKESTEIEPISNLPKSVFALTSLLILLPAAYISYLTYQSYVVQNRVIPDLNNEPLKLPLKEVINAFPSMPNLTSSAQPIDAIIGRYLYESKKYKEAITYLNRGSLANPYIRYAEFLKADVYYGDNQIDSAFKYATMAYFDKPRAKTYYQTLIAVCAKKGDTVTLKKAFNLFTKYRPNFSFAWNFYLMGMLNAKTKGNPQLLALADSAVRMFPDDKEILKRRNEIFTFMPSTALNATAIQGNEVARSNALFKEGTDLFNKGDFAGAAQKFISSSKISNGTYGVYENIAICYFNLKQWPESLPYFDRVLSMKTATDGKTEYFKAAALLNLNRKDEACALLQISKSKGYPAADGLITGYCK